MNIDQDTIWRIIEWFGVISGLLYLWYEFLQKKAMWIVGGISSMIYICVFAWAKVYADMCFNIYNVAISIYGLVLWQKTIDTKQEKSSEIEYDILSLKQWIVLGAVAVPIYFAIWFCLYKFTDSPIPYGDSFTTTLSIVAAWALAKRYIDHWLIWMVVNAFSIGLYYSRGLYPTMLLYAFYTIASVAGYMIWKKKGIKV